MKKLLLILALIIPSGIVYADYYDVQHYVVEPDTTNIRNVIHFRGDFKLYDDTDTVKLENATPKVIFYASGTVVVATIEATTVIFHSTTTIFANTVTFSSAATFTSIEVATLTVTTLYSPGVQVKIGTFASPGATGNLSITGLGFEPRYVEFNAVRGSAVAVQNGNGRISYNGDQHAFAWASQDDLQRSISFSDRCIYSYTAAGVAQISAIFVSMDADGFTIDFTVRVSGYNIFWKAVR